MKSTWSICVLFLMFNDISAKVFYNDSQADYSDYNENIYKKYIQMDKQLKNIAERSVKKLLPYLLDARQYVNISANCANNLFDLVMGFKRLTNWSFNFLDATGKLQSGFQAGNIQMFGEYEECIETRVMKNGKVSFQGEFCLLECKPLLPKVKKIPGINGRLEGLIHATRNTSDLMKLLVSNIHAFYAFSINIGLCVPSGCTEQDISEITKYTLEEYVNCTVSHCLKEGDIYFWTTRRIVIVSVFVLLGTVVIVSTYCDYMLDSWKRNKIGLKLRILQCFSLIRNFPNLMNTKTSENSVRCLNGIRVLGMFWIILGHEFFFRALSLASNHMRNFSDRVVYSFFSQIALNGFMAVDTFFFLSGFVNSYSRMLIKQDGKPQPGFLKIIVHRLWRIYPAYIVAFLVMYLLTKLQPFSSYRVTEEFVGENCDVNWWQNFLFISNFLGPYKMCMAQTWFLCVDMQLFLVTLFTIPVLLRNPKKGIILHVGIILIVNLCSMTWWWVDEIPPSTLDSTKLDRNEAKMGFFIYTLAPVHVGSYFIGILLGYVIAAKKNIKMTKVVQIFGWLIGSFLFISMVFMTLIWNSGTPYTSLDSSLYGAWSRTIMVLGLAWLVFCCATGYGGLINYILSLKLWVPLARITYMLYLISAYVQSHYFSHKRLPNDFLDTEIIWTYFANLTISILMSFALVLISESPMIAMEKVIFRRNRDKNKATSDLPQEMISNNIKENGFQENGKNVSIHL